MSVPNFVAQTIAIWKSCQVGLPQVVRWGKYVSADPRLRVQNTLQHSFSLQYVGFLMAIELAEFVNLDQNLLSYALYFHDWGEGEIKQDTVYVDKKEDYDLREYLAFCKLMRGSPIFGIAQKAFLLQFARKNPSSFPEDARQIMAKIQKENIVEALAFDAIERLDYVLYALEHFLELENRKMATEVLRNQVPHLDRLAKELPGFSQKFWTKEFRDYCYGILNANKQVEPEKKDGQLFFEFIK